MKASKECLDLIKHFEGTKLKPYLCPALLWTIGTGSVLYPEQAKLPMDQRKAFPLRPEHNRQWSKEEVDKLLAEDVARFERGVERLLPNARLSQSEYDCLVSFSFNLGLGTFQRSTIRQALLRGDKKMAVESLLKYNKAGGKVLKGLDLRRKAEAALFMKE